MEAARQSVELDVPGTEAIRLVNERVSELLWTLHYAEEMRTKDGHGVAVAFGTTEPFGGSTFFSLFMRGAASVAFLLRVEELGPRRTRVEILAGGTEGWAGFDYGRNRAVTKRFLTGLGTP